MTELSFTLQFLRFHDKIVLVKAIFRKGNAMKKKLQSTFESRQYMLSRDFELYYYDDKDLAKVESHSHNYFEFYFFIEGDVSMQIGKQTYRVRSGDVMLIPPHVPHRLIIHSPKTPYRRFVFWISKEFYEHLSQLSSAYMYLIEYVDAHKDYLFQMDPVSFNTLQSKMIRLLEEMHAERFGKDEQIALYISDFILHINRLVYEKNEPKNQPLNTSLYSNLVEYIEQHLDEDLTLERLADEFYVSKYHIAHVFKENVGLSIHQYITKKRLSLCQEAIRAKMNISEVYHAYGFGDYSSFYRAFKKEFGISPKEFRDIQLKVISKE